MSDKPERVWIETAGRIHRGARLAPSLPLLTAEGCNLDDAAARVEITAESARERLAQAPTLACGNCHPERALFPPNAGAPEDVPE